MSFVISGRQNDSHTVKRMTVIEHKIIFYLFQPDSMVMILA
jgi:hypothetical protein